MEVIPLLGNMQDAGTVVDQVLRNRPELPAWTMFLMDLIKTVPAIGALLILMILDVFTGLLAALIAKAVSSSASWQGMLRKVFMLMLVMVGLVMEMIYEDIPWGRLIAGFLCVVELISIAENAGKAGIPLPPQLLDTLHRLKAADSQKAVTIKASLSGIMTGATPEVLPVEPPKPEPPKNGANIHS